MLTPFPLPPFYPKKIASSSYVSKFTEHFEYSDWKNMPSVADHSKHFELMQVPIEHQRKEAEAKEAEGKGKGKKFWKK